MKQKPYEALKNDDSELGLEFVHNKFPKCPHCGYDFNDLTDYYEIYEEGEHELECPNCDLAFDVSTHVEVTFSTDYIPPEFRDEEGEQ